MHLGVVENTSFMPPAFSILPYRGKIYICAVVHLLSMHLQYFARKCAIAVTHYLRTVADTRERIYQWISPFLLISF